MINVRALTEAGLVHFRQWLDAGALGTVPDSLSHDALESVPITDRAIDSERRFSSRYEFGCYLHEVFNGLDPEHLLASERDGMWAWINALYFRQLAPVRASRFEHYIPTRKGSAGSLLHRNAARTAFELVAVHGENARFALQQKMRTHGQLLESLSASQSVVRNKGFFAAAAKLYVGAEGSIRPGATSKPKRPKDRKPGDESGKGSIRRLPIALKRLDLTFDVEVMTPDDLILRLPREYARWTR